MALPRWKRGLALGLLFLLTGLATVMAVAEGRAADRAVDIRNLAFNPASLSIAPGDRVTWTNQDAEAHTVTSTTAGQFNSGSIAPGGTFAQTFASAGTFAYQCTIHPTMTGSVTVSASAPATGNAGLADGGNDGYGAVIALVAGVAAVAGAGVFTVWRRHAA